MAQSFLRAFFDFFLAFFVFGFFLIRLSIGLWPAMRAPCNAALNLRAASSFGNSSSAMAKKQFVGSIQSEGKLYPMKLITFKRAKAALRPCSVELGYLAVAWNQLHLNLLALFVLLLGARREPHAKALWYSLDSDFSQRKLLRTIIDTEIKILPQSERTLPATQAEDILWLLDQIDNSLRHKRNNAIHAPLMVIQGVVDDAIKIWGEVHFDPQNPRAKPLRSKNLIQEYKDYTALTEGLATYAIQIVYALRFGGHHPWPDRPLSPLAHKTKAKARQGKRKQPSHQQEASEK